MEAHDFCKAELERLPPEALRPKRLLSGDDLIELGIPEGPRIGQILRQIEDEQLEGAINTEAEARALLKRLLMNKPRHKGNIAYTKHRFPDTPLEEVRLRIAEFSETLQRFQAVRAEQYDDNIFSISAIASQSRT